MFDSGVDTGCESELTFMCDPAARRIKGKVVALLRVQGV